MDWLLLAQEADPELIRPFFSFDFDDILSLVIAATALIALFVTKRSSTKTVAEEKRKAHEVSEVVDDSVLGRFQELLERIGKLETDLALAKEDLAQALVEIRELRKLEEYLQARLHQKDEEVRKLEASRAKHMAETARLRKELQKARDRITHLEEVCKRAGINGDEAEEA